MSRDAKNIYKLVIAEIERIIGSVSDNESHSEQLKRSGREANKMLGDLQETVKSELKNLDQVAVWDKIVMAFYGETNSGKSTIVETLRILFKEKTKVEERKEFGKYHTTYVETVTELTELTTKIDAEHRKAIARMEDKIIKQRAFLISAQHNWFYLACNKLRMWFGGKKRRYGEKKLGRLGAKMDRLVHTNPLEGKKRVEKLTKRVDELVQKITPLQDGAIIGTGMQDFTTKSVAYDLDYKDRQFSIVDLPGIEGKEEAVEQDIIKGIGGAHCVFYVVNGDKLPERRTIEKMKQHLLDQADVYVIINYRANNYLLEHLPTSIEDLHPELNDLKREVDVRMKAILGLNYKGCLGVQALLAFFSDANLIQNTSAWRKQQNLKDRLGDKLHECSNIDELSGLIKQLVSSTENRIELVNIQKGLSRMYRLADTLDQIRKMYYGEGELKELERLFLKFSSASKLSVAHFEGALQSVVELQVDDTINYLRQEMTKLIRSYIKQPDILKSLLTSIVNRIDSIIQREMEKRIAPILEELKQNLQKNIEEFQSDVNLLSDKELNTQLHFEVDLSYNYRTSMQQLAVNCITFAGTVLTFGSLGALLGSWAPIVGNFLGGFLGSLVGVAVAAWNWIRGESAETKALRRLENSLRNEFRPQLKKHLDSAMKDVSKQVEGQVALMCNEFEQELDVFKNIVDVLKCKAAELRIGADILQLSGKEEEGNVD